MKHFLSIILRNQFNLFYRFGYTFIPENQLLEFNGNINTKIKEQIVKLFETITPFEYDQEYLILHFEKSEELNNNILKFQIQELVSIYPLSQQAKISIESKIDTRIKLENPIFESVLPEIETIIENHELKSSIEAISRVLDLNLDSTKYVSKIGYESIISGLNFRKNGTKSNKIIDGNYWEYLLAYDRYEYFPNDMLGYFYDAGEIFAYSKGQPTFVGSKLYNLLEDIRVNKSDIHFKEIINKLEASEETKNYISQTSIDDLRLYIITPLFLMLRDEIRKSDDITQTKLLKNLEYLKKFDDSFNYAVILLGAFFGFRKFYDNYYEVLNLRFYKDYKTPQMQTEKNEQEEKVDNISKTNESTIIVIENEQVKEEQAKTTNEEKIIETASVEEHILLTKEEQTEIIVEKQNDIYNTQQDENKEVVSDITSKYQKIIEQALDKQPEVKLTDIASMIKEQTGNKVQNGIVENVAKQMNGIEIIKIGKAKGIRRTTGTLFNEQ